MKADPVTISFEATLYSLKDWLILPVPKPESSKLSSRGQVAVEATINDHQFQTVLEPDGRLSHWVRVDDGLQKVANIKSGDRVRVVMTTTKAWPEPTLTKDFVDALGRAPQKVKDKWLDITPMARWEWLRWINSTANPETRATRIEKSISKLNGKHRRPCCFNLAACTEPYVARNGQLQKVTTGTAY